MPIFCCSFSSEIKCHLIFKSKSLIITPTNAMCKDDQICDTEIIVAENAISYYYNMSSYIAFQGYVFYDDWNDDDCRLSSVSRIIPFHFEDESQILQIESEFKSHPCIWQFTAPKGYQFKLFLTRLGMNSTLKILSHNESVIA